MGFEIIIPSMMYNGIKKKNKLPFFIVSYREVADNIRIEMNNAISNIHRPWIYTVK
ncbi:hypothetical protein MASR2M36_28590 [Providencia sp.]